MFQKRNVFQDDLVVVSFPPLSSSSLPPPYLTIRTMMRIRTMVTTVPPMQIFIFMFSHHIFFLSLLPVVANWIEDCSRLEALASKSVNFSSRSIILETLFLITSSTSLTCVQFVSNYAIHVSGSLAIITSFLALLIWASGLSW